MSAKTETKTHEWLASLTDQQLRTLGSQHKVEGWQSIGIIQLQNALAVLPGIVTYVEMIKEVPETD